MESKIRVLGARRFNDAVEGKSYNFTKVRLEMPVPRNSENELGTNVVEANYGDASKFVELMAMGKFPMDCLVDLEPSSKGFDVVSIKPAMEAKAIKAA